MTLPLLHSLKRRFGVVIQWASDFREFLKNVSGIQILPTMLLLSMSNFIVLLNLSRLSYHVWAKKMSMVYSCNIVREYLNYTKKCLIENIPCFFCSLSTAERMQKKMKRSTLTMLMGSTGPILLTYMAVSITVGLTEISQKMYCIDKDNIHFWKLKSVKEDTKNRIKSSPLTFFMPKNRQMTVSSHYYMRT